MIAYITASSDHFDAIYAFCQKLIVENARMSFTDVTSEAVLWSWMEDERIKLYIAIDEGRVVGMLRTKRGAFDQAHAVQIACAVDIHYRNQQIATNLTNYGLDQAKLEGVLIARTLIYDWNTPSIKAIKKCGFIESGRIPMVHYNQETGTSEDDLLFYKML